MTTSLGKDMVFVGKEAPSRRRRSDKARFWYYMFINWNQR